MRGFMLWVMSTSPRSAAVERSDSLKASACAAAVLLLSMFRSNAVVCKLPLASRRERSWMRYSQLGAVGDVAVAIVAREQLHANLKLVRLVEGSADLLDVRLARDVLQLLFDVGHLAVDHFVRHFCGPRLAPGYQ
eukprot:6185220-Pleurochrysis_carterae.AAC.1